MTNPVDVQAVPPDIPRKDVVGGSVTAKEKERIEAARDRAGIKTMSEFVRETMLARAEVILAPKRREDREQSAA